MDENEDEFDMDLDMNDVLAVVDQVESRAHITSNHLNSNDNDHNTTTLEKPAAYLDDYDFDDDFDDFDVEALLHDADAVEKQKSTIGKNQAQSSLSAYYGNLSTNNAPPTASSSSSFQPPSLNNTINSNNATIATERSSNTRITFGIPEDVEDPTPPAPPPPDAKTFHPFDSTSLPTWIYPTNHPIRGYQFNIVKKALFSNTLVSIPTGLGKTFIASVVMYNFYRWFPNSIMIFMAPTRPLVEQQIKACHDVCGIPQKDTVIMVGTGGKVKRPELWAKGRIFFCTPQVVDNDLANGVCPAHKVALLVIDEAHRATGNYAYTNVVERLGRIHSHFRVLALSATPGSTVDKVQAVINNLRINTIEVRTEESMDVQEFSFGKRVQNIVIKLDYTSGATGVVPRTAQSFCQQVFQPVLDRLAKRKAIFGPTVERCSPFILLTERKNYQTNCKNVPQAVKRMITVDFLLAEAFARAYEGLCVYGMGTFVDTLDRFLQSIRTDIEAGKNVPSEVYKTLNHFGLKQILDQSRQQMAIPGFVGHPKLDSLLTIILRHFAECSGDQQQTNNDLTTVSSSSRIMVFSTLRASVNMIIDFLSPHHPLIRCSPFIGQAGNTQGAKGMSQKEQQQTIERFKKGDFNVMVATSIGEEGLDIGEVDLIVCYDSQSSSIRLLQRMGRTGRRRKGHCVMLMTEQEERKFKKATDSYKYIQSSISKQNVIECCDEITSLLPTSYQPVVQRKRLVIGNYLTTMVQGMKRQRQGDNTTDFQKNGTLSNHGLEALLATLPEGDFSSLDQVYNQFWPSFHPLKGALKYLSLQQNQNQTMRVGHSHRTIQFASLMKKMEDRILDGSDGVVQYSQNNDFGNNHTLKLPKRRKPTSNMAINNTDSTYDNIDEDDPKNPGNNNNNKLTLPTLRNSRTTTIDITESDDQQDSEIVEEVSSDTGDIGEVDWTSFMEPLLAKGMADDEDNCYQDYQCDFYQEHQDVCDLTMDMESQNRKATPYITLDSNNHIDDIDKQPTNVPDKKQQHVVPLEDSFDDDFDDLDMDMNLLDDLETQAIQTQQQRNVQRSTFPPSGFLFDDDLLPLISEDEEKHDSPLAHSSTNFTASFVWTKSNPIFSDQARQILIQRLQDYNDYYLTVRLLGDQYGSGKSTNPIITLNSLPPSAKSPDLYGFDHGDDIDFGKLDERIDIIIDAPTGTQLKYMNPAASEQRVMIDNNDNDNDNSNNTNTNNYDNDKCGNRNSSTGESKPDLGMDNVVEDGSVEWSITDSQLYEIDESTKSPLQLNNVNMKMTFEQNGCVHNDRNNTDIPNVQSFLSSDKLAKGMDCGTNSNSMYSWEINDELDDTSNHVAPITPLITTTLQKDKIHVDSPIPVITTPPTPLAMSSGRLIHSTPQDQQRQQHLGKASFGNQSQYLHSPISNNNNNNIRSPLGVVSTQNEISMKTIGASTPGTLDGDSIDTPIVRRKRSRRTHIIRDSEDEPSQNSLNQNHDNLDTNTDDDDMANDLTKHSSQVENTPMIISSDDEEKDYQQHKKTTHHRSKRWGINPFLDNEAERSDDGVDTGDEDEMEDASNVMDSFIYDGSSELVPESEGDNGNSSLMMAPEERVMYGTSGSGKKGKGNDNAMAMYRSSLLQHDVATTHIAPPIFASDFRRKTWLDKMETKKWEYVANDDDDDDDDEVFHDASDVYSDALLDGPSADGVSEDISRFTNASDDFV